MVPCEAQGDDACPVAFPPAEPDHQTGLLVWDAWSLYWQIEAVGWEAVRDLARGLSPFRPGDCPPAGEEADWILDALQQIEVAVRQRRAADLQPKT